MLFFSEETSTRRLVDSPWSSRFDLVRRGSGLALTVALFVIQPTAAGCRRAKVARERQGTTNDARQSTNANQGVYVIGRELAKAKVAEERRLERRRRQGLSTASPLPKKGYASLERRQSLIDPSPIPLDKKIRKVCTVFRNSTTKRRTEMRDSITSDQLYDLLDFSRRAAVFSVRQRSSQWLNDSVTALAMIDARRVDYRDVVLTVGITRYAAAKIGADAKKLFEAAASMSAGSTKAIITTATRDDKKTPDIRSMCGLSEIRTKNGFGLIGWAEPVNEFETVAVRI